MISRHLVKYVLTAARRDKLMMTLVLMIALAAALSVFMGSAATLEPGSFSLAFGAGGLRVLGVTGLVLFCCFYVRRAFESKEVEFLLSRPISRSAFLFSHAAAFALLAAVVAAIVTLVIFALGRPDPAGLVLWGASVAIEFALMAVTGLFFSMVLTSAAGSALASLGFYALARMIGVLLGIVDIPPANAVFAVLGSVMKVISTVVPRFDLMGQTTWLVYGPQGSGGVVFMPQAGSYAYAVMEHLGLSGFFMVQGMLFAALLLAAASYDFARKQF